ncbi:hypothetical protein EIN_044110 [Entamoeba invadens IP1]|uniref:Ral GTPase-activating protein subunit alpha/beta N-terminal domain-containing protein n=1 Tax=Entamoeba invadens IP1 TaxID=370355 RepID=A0A0A1U2K0_ENTIV|nr:hypothetical protein EIN_044110 [Entamoeba invadens IP1]ELP86863.1 hypothetical protein EIN_044110 [Entamoeba invadens IP1]|eukprot:XP_004253634.1 hypothetical protein EIN_044110 [Entamoeba invadens IP1]
MFVEATQKLKLMEYGETSNLYQMFDLPLQTLISTNMGKYIITDISAFNTKIKTTTHFDYILESLGYSFGLPVESSQTIDNSIKIYNSWLFECVPDVVKTNWKKYLNIMIEHLSLIFTQRTLTQQQTPVMVEFSNRVLDIYDKVLEDKHVDIDHLVRLLIGALQSLVVTPKQGITSIMSSNVSSNFYKAKDKKVSLAEEVSGRVVNTLYRAWIKLLPTDKTLWDSMCTNHKLWSVLLPVAQQWRTFMYVLTQKLVDMLYSSVECEIEYKGTTEQVVTKNVIPPQYAHKMWMTFLHLIGSPLMSNNSHVFDVVVMALGEQIDLMISKKCTGETILRVYNIIFQCVVLPSHTKFENGVVHAVEAMMRIFTETYDFTTFTEHSLKHFYHAISFAMSSESDKVLAVALKLYNLILDKQFDGIEILSKTVLYAIHRAILLKDPVFVQLRGAMINIISSCASYTPEAVVKFIPEQTEEVEKKYTTQYLVMLNLYLILKHQTDAVNVYEVLTVLHRFFIEHLQHNSTPANDFTPDIVNTRAPQTPGELAWYFVKVINYNQGILLNSNTLPQNRRAIFDVVKLLIQYSKYIPNTKEFLAEVFTILSEFFDKWKKENELSLIADALPVLTAYFTELGESVTQQQMTALTVLYKKLTSIETFYKTKGKEDPNYEEAHAFVTALNYSITLMYQHRFINAPTFSSELYNSQISESALEKLLMAHGVTTPLEHMFIASIEGQALLSFIELPYRNSSGLKEFVVINRDGVGKKSYILSLKEIEDTVTLNYPQEVNSVERQMPPQSIVVPDQKVLEELSALNSVTPLDTTNFLSEVVTRMNPPHIEKVPSVLYNNVMQIKHATKFYAARMFVASMGLFAPESLERLTPLEVSHESLEALDTIDKMQSHVHVGVTIDNCESGVTENFMKFLKQFAKIRTKSGFEGDVSGYEQAEQLIVYQDYQYDVVCHSNVVIPTQCKEDKVVIRWGISDKVCDDEKDKLVIHVVPLPSGVFNVFASKNSPILLPFQKMLLSGLGDVLRFACIHNVMLDSISPFKTRKIALKDFSDKYSNVKCRSGIVQWIFSKSISSAISTEKLTEFESQQKTVQQSQEKDKSKLIKVQTTTTTQKITGELKAAEEAFMRKSQVKRTNTNGALLSPTTPKK